MQLEQSTRDFSLIAEAVRRAVFCPCLTLLPLGVAWPSSLLRTPVVSYTTISPLPKSGGVFLWPDPAGCPAPGVTRQSALGSADFPRLWKSEPRPLSQPVVN
jgi:hypothetical protein